MALHARERGPAILLGDHLHVVQLVGVHLARAERAHLARAHQAVERLHGLLDRRAVVKAMDDIEVEVVGSQALERAVDLAVDGLARETPLVEEDLAGKYHLLARDAELPECAADVFLACAERVGIGRVDKVYAAIESVGDHLLGVLRSDRPLVKVGRGLAEAHAS